MRRLDLPLFPEQASTVAGQVDALYFYVMGVSMFFAILIALAVVGFAVKYRRRSDSELPLPMHGSIPLEVLWMVIPFGISMTFFFWGASVFLTLSRPPDDALEIFVVGKQWMWKLQHREGRREINELHVPIGRAVKLTMTSEDVIHSFFVPAFRIKADVLPGRYSATWFEATKRGEYHLFCAEYCGTDHSHMIGRVVVMEPADYQAWLGGAPAPGTNVGTSMVSSGEELFQRFGCVTCHRSDSGALGPSLAGVFGKTVALEGGQTVQVDERYVRESILNPQAKVVAGYRPVMPTFQGQIDEDQLMQLIQYIKTLGPAQASAGPGSGPDRDVARLRRGAEDG
jgi:cytochrome c oxidase subunit 2